MLKLCSLQQAAVLLISHESVPKKGNKLLVSYNITKQMPCTIKTLYCMLKAEGSICVNVLFQDTKLKKHVLTCGLVLAIHCTGAHKRDFDHTFDSFNSHWLQLTCTCT
uniref:Uncharacterized protein n=1 Tax=Gossypium raimondii TaxID=29730 RepID=A0A0D2PQK9_GOSRA|nr:hypothetical protein B456_001G127400 [Gossypium raimondii]